MIRRPPRSTRTDTLFPYTTLFRSHRVVTGRRGSERATGAHHLMIANQGDNAALNADHTHAIVGVRTQPAADQRIANPSKTAIGKPGRSEERRVGKEGVSTCRSRWSPYH